MAGRTPSQLDLTGSKAASLAKENADVLKERQVAISLVNAAQAVLKDEPIDLTRDPEPVVIDPVVDLTPEAVVVPERVTSGGLQVVEEAKNVPYNFGAQGVSHPEEVVKTVEDDYVYIRTLEDLEEPSIGTWTTDRLVAGQKYRVPRNVADHLGYLGRLDPRL